MSFNSWFEALSSSELQTVLPLQKWRMTSYDGAHRLSTQTGRCGGKATTIVASFRG